jgi:YaiO family outer membrane protein
MSRPLTFPIRLATLLAALLSSAAPAFAGDAEADSAATPAAAVPVAASDAAAAAPAMTPAAAAVPVAAGDAAAAQPAAPPPTAVSAAAGDAAAADPAATPPAAVLVADGDAAPADPAATPAAATPAAPSDAAPAEPAAAPAPAAAIPSSASDSAESADADRTAATAPAHTKTVDVGGAVSELTHGYGNWESATGRLVYEPAPGNTTYAEVSLAREFSETGEIVSLGHVHELAQVWILTGFITAGGGGDFEPEYKVDLSLGRKLLSDLNLVGTVGVSADRFRDGHTDQALVASLAWYRIPLWVLEGGVRFNWSNPGDVAGRRYYAAATWGQEGKDFIAVRGETGNEAYQVIGPAPGQALVNFDSQLASVTWRHWLGSDHGFVVGGEVYHNPAYDRFTVSGAAFFQF